MNVIKSHPAFTLSDIYSTTKINSSFSHVCNSAKAYRMPVATTSRNDRPRAGGNGHLRSSASPEAGPSRKSRVIASQDADGGHPEEGQEEEEDGWTKETFVSQPISKNSTAMPMFRTMIDKFKDVISRIEEGIDSARETAITLEEAKQDDESIEQVENAIFRAFDQRQILQIKIEVLEHLIAKLRENESFDNIEKVFDDETDRREREYLARSQQAKYKKVKEYQDFRQALWEINHQSACPPVSDWLERGPDDQSDDEDFEVGGETQNYRCPITLMLFKDVVSSTKCHHNYSRAAITNLIENAKKARRSTTASAKCPVTGCSAQLQVTDLKPNPALQKRADEFERRRLRREDENEEGDDTIRIDEEDDE
ncbi:hypothetical protein IAR55_002723 [Kwoniella newhampshirensis]|uniref:SP-RING-type domain-containing protein n=1 Tax=Kwoniella newhampshirensis TaxID=1651941 RepID=A0AAW0YSK1_9TREE